MMKSVKSARLQMPTLSYLKLNSLLRRWRFLRPLQAKPMAPRRIFPHPNTSYLLISPSIQPLAGLIRNTLNTLLEPHVLVVPTFPVISTSMPQRETPGPLLTHLHPRPQFVSSRLDSSARAPAPALAAPIGPIVTPLPRYAAYYDHFESWDLGSTDMELGSAAQLLNALPPSDGTRREVVLWNGSSALDRVLPLRFDISNTLCMYTRVLLCPLFDVCVRSCSTSPGITNTSLQPASAPAPASLSLEPYAYVDGPHSRYVHLGAQQQIQPTMRQTQPMQQMRALQGSLMYAVPSKRVISAPPTPLPTTTILPQSRPVTMSAS